MTGTKKRVVCMGLLALLMFAGTAWVSGGGKAEEQTPEGAAEATAEPRYGGTLIIGTNQDLGKLDLHLTTNYTDREMLLHIQEQLVTMDEQYKVTGMLAKDWEISEDGRTYTFHLRQGVLFHNGNEMTADDVAYSLERFKKEGVRKKDLAVIESIEVAGKYAVKVRINEKSAVFLSALANPVGPVVIIPEGEVERQGGQISQPIGTGPFEFAKWDSGRALVLKRFEDYAADDRPAGGFSGKKIPYVDEVVFRIIPESSVRASSLETGEIHVASRLNIMDAEQLDGHPDVTTNIWPSSTYNDLRFGHKNGPMTDLNMRKAVAYAVDREEISEACTMGQGTVATSAVLPDSFWYSDAHREYPEHDPRKAKEYLEQAGYRNELIKITARRNNVWHDKIAPVIEAELEAAGMNVEIQGLETAAYLDRWLSGNFHIFISGMSVRPDPDYYYGTMWHSSSSPAGYSNPEYDRLVEAGRTTMDLEKRKEIYEQLHKVMMEDLPWMALDYRVEATGRLDSVHGLNMSWSAAYVRAWNVWLSE